MQPIPLAVKDYLARLLFTVVAASAAATAAPAHLGYFHQYAQDHHFFELNRGSFRTIKVRAGGVVHTCAWRDPPFNVVDPHVTVKKMLKSTVLKNKNVTRVSDDWACHSMTLNDPRLWRHQCRLTEIAVYQFLAEQPDSPLYLLRTFGAFWDLDDGPPAETWLVMESCDYDVLDYIFNDGSVITEDFIKKCMWQLCQALKYMHLKNLGHRDVSLENLLLKTSSTGEKILKLMDFDQVVRLRADEGTPLRYFRPPGKDNYRAPEAYVPRVADGDCNRLVWFEVPEDAQPGAIIQADILSQPGVECVYVDMHRRQHRGFHCMVQLPQELPAGGLAEAQIVGYEVGPIDVLAGGVCFFMMAYQTRPWNFAVRSDGSFNFVKKQGIEELLRRWGKELMSSAAMTLMTRMLSVNPTERPTMDECLADPWFAAYHGMPPQVHPPLNRRGI